ncbi:MAG: hypothetical protein RML32_02850, partial [Gammaproteobacteria bacterium]|nr:hypothetical protein [Gammaproteobacteria bacterium]
MSKEDPVIRPGAVPWFSAEDWSPDSYLSLAGNAVICGLLWARRPGTGAFSRLEAAVLAAGKEMHVP